jgi:DNA-binding beta-propeller fold protein YncE
MQLNKTYLNVGIGLLVMAGLTAFLVFKAPNRNGAAAAKPASDPAGLNQPRGLAFAADGDTIIVDSRNNRLVIRHPDGTLVKYVGAAFGVEGEGKGEFREPCDAAVDAAGDVFVADTFHTLDAKQGLPWGRIEKLNSSYDYMGEVSQSGNGAPGFFGPRAVAVDHQGRVWLSDTGNSRLLVFDNNLKFIRAIGSRGTGNLQFQEPFGLAADAEGNMYVADRLNFRIQVISPDFRLLRQFKVDGWEQSQINQFPYLALDSRHHWLWISDPTKHRILRTSLTGGGRKVFEKASFGPMTTSLDLPTGVAVAPDGTLLISDSGSGHILTLKP